MRPRSRILLDAATILSLVVFAGATILWVRGAYGSDLVTLTFRARPRQPARPPPGRDHPLPEFLWLRVETSCGYLAWSVSDPGMNGHDAPPVYLHYRRGGRAPGLAPVGTSAANRIGFEAFEVSPDETLYTVPLWAVLAGALVLPAARGWRVWRARGRRRRGLCVACGYDLRATPDRCPECGHITAGDARRTRIGQSTAGEG